MEWFNNFYWGDWKYHITVPLCLIVGHWLGWMRHKERCERERHTEALKLAIKVYLEDAWEEG